RALALMHQRPAEAWTVERLGEEAALSRSTLHERFAHFIGQPPMQYLTQWRMQLATGWLRDTDAKVVEVALEVGYESEAAFSRAFKRAVGESPGAWRRVRRGRPEVRVAAKSQAHDGMPVSGSARPRLPHPPPGGLRGRKRAAPSELGLEHGAGHDR